MVIVLYKMDCCEYIDANLMQISRFAINFKYLASSKKEKNLTSVSGIASVT